MNPIRLRRFLLILLFFSPSAFAQPSGSEYLFRFGGTTTPFYKGPESACAANLTKPNKMFAGSVQKNGDAYSCVYTDTTEQPPTGNKFLSGLVERFTEPLCVKPKFRNWTTGRCEIEPEPEKKCKDAPGTRVRVTVYEGSGPLGAARPTTPQSATFGFPKQNATCKFSGTSPQNLTVEHCDSDVVNGEKRWTCTYSAESSGQEIDQSIPGGGGVVVPPAADSKPEVMSPKPIEKGPCPTGSVGGLVDGVLNCYGEGVSPGQPTKAPVVSTETKSTDSNGNQVSTAVKTSGNSDGSETKTTTVTTTKSDGTVEIKTSTEVTKTATGDNGKPDKPDTDFCKSNPNLTVCKNSTAKAVCGAVTCNGDAIQCEILNQQTLMRCASEQDTKDLKNSSAYALGSAVLSGNDPLSSSLPKPGNSVSISVPTSLTTSGWLGGGSCFADKSVSVMGKTIVLPFSKACEYLIVLRYALMVVASLVSFKILRGSFLSE